ncbi:MAG: hypothetical protein ACRDQD_00505 [Nocardioidaceae bacterium]
MQPLGLSAAQYAAYVDRLFSSHDFRITAEILTLDEKVTGQVTLLDGQVNVTGSDAEVRRTATMTVSDPTGALDFAGASTWSGTSVWLDRLVRITHSIYVPALSRTITVTPFIGPPSKMTRNGAEVSAELQDKTALSNRGAQPFTVPAGAVATTAIKQILQRTGEFRFRFGTYSKRLTKAYSVGWADETSPWAIAKRIAGEQLGAQLIMSCDGYVVVRPTPGSVALNVPFVTEPPQSGVDFTRVSNYVRVEGKATEVTKGSVTTTTQPVAAAQVAEGALTPGSLARQGKARFLPTLIQSDAYTTLGQAKEAASNALTSASRIQAEPTFACVPFFHLDADDIVRFNTPTGTVDARLNNCSIPLGAEEMSVGYIRWVSAAPRQRLSGRKVVSRSKA